MTKKLVPSLTNFKLAVPFADKQGPDKYQLRYCHSGYSSTLFQVNIHMAENTKTIIQCTEEVFFPLASINNV